MTTIRKQPYWVTLNDNTEALVVEVPRHWTGRAVLACPEDETRIEYQCGCQDPTPRRCPHMRVIPEPEHTT